MGKIDIEKEDSIHVSCLFHFAYQKKQQRSLLTQRMLSLKENVGIKNLHLVMMINKTSTEHRKTTKYAEILRNKGSYVFVYFKS